MRKFEKISFEQFKKDINDDLELYNSYSLPKRGTKYAAGYDIFSLEDFTLAPGETKKIATGIKADMMDDEVLYILVRSSMGFKYNVRLCNQVGVVDKDYYNNEGNEGHIFIKIKNEGEKDFVVSKGDAIGQGIFMKYLLTDDDITENVRIGGIGSTNKEG